MKNNRGFTLIELIIVLVMMGFVGAGLTSMFANIFQAYLLSKNSTETSINVQIALSRITIELQNATPTSIESNGTGEIRYSNSKSWPLIAAIRSQSNSIDLLPQSGGTAYQLLPGSMSIDYIDTDGDSHTTWPIGGEDLKMIQVTITVPGIDPANPQDHTFSTKIIPRG